MYLTLIQKKQGYIIELCNISFLVFNSIVQSIFHFWSSQEGKVLGLFSCSQLCKFLGRAILENCFNSCFLTFVVAIVNARIEILVQYIFCIVHFLFFCISSQVVFVKLFSKKSFFALALIFNRNHHRERKSGGLKNSKNETFGMYFFVRTTWFDFFLKFVIKEQQSEVGDPNCFWLAFFSIADLTRAFYYFAFYTCSFFKRQKAQYV